MSHVRCQVSHVRCHMSCVTCHVSHVTSNSQTVRAKELKYLKKGSPPPTSHVSCVMCHMSRITFHMSCITCNTSLCFVFLFVYYIDGFVWFLEPPASRKEYSDYHLFLSIYLGGIATEVNTNVSTKVLVHAMPIGAQDRKYTFNICT